VTIPVAIIGAAGLPVGRHQARKGETPQALEHELLAEVVIDAVAGAGIGKDMIDALVFAIPRAYTQQLYYCTFIANFLRLAVDGIVGEVQGNGMTGGLAFDQAAMMIASGRAKVALALGSSFETAVDSAEHMNRSMRATGDIDFHTPFGFTPIAWYAMDAMRYLHDSGASRADLASVAVKNRRHAGLNPLAQYRDPITLADVLAQRPIVAPLGLYEVPPRSDGAVCLVLARADLAKDLGRPHAIVKGRGFHHEGAHQINERPSDMTAFQACRRAGQAALGEAGLAAADMDLAELYAPCTIVEVLAAEALGLVPRGRGAFASRDGETALGGRIPICTSGGCLSRGHPPMVTPLYGYLEIFEQLTGRAGARQVADAEHAIASCELGNYNAAMIHVFEGRA